MTLTDTLLTHSHASVIIHPSILCPTIDHLDPPDLPRHGCNSDWGPAASGGPTVLANDRNGGRLRLNASRHDDDDDDDPSIVYYAKAAHKIQNIATKYHYHYDVDRRVNCKELAPMRVMIRTKTCCGVTVRGVAWLSKVIGNVTAWPRVEADFFLGLEDPTVRRCNVIE